MARSFTVTHIRMRQDGTFVLYNAKTGKGLNLAACVNHHKGQAVAYYNSIPVTVAGRAVTPIANIPAKGGLLRFPSA